MRKRCVSRSAGLVTGIVVVTAASLVDAHAAAAGTAAKAGQATAARPAAVGPGVGMGPVAAVAPGTVGRSFGPDHRVTTTGYAYDAAGNLTADPAGVTYTYDAANRLTSTTRPATTTAAGLTVTYRYDALGNRVQQTKTTTPATGTTGTTPVTGTSVTSDLLVDESSNLPVVLGDLRSDNTASYYVHGPDGPTLRRDNPNTTATALTSTVLLGDTHASIRATTTTAGAVTTTATYDPDGNPRASTTGATSATPAVITGTGGPGFTGEWTSPDGTINLRARAYAPTQALFLQADTYPGTLTRPLSQNPYTPFENNPTTYTDPTGNAIDYVGGVIEDVRNVTEEPDTRGVTPATSFSPTLSVLDGTQSAGGGFKNDLKEGGQYRLVSGTYSAAKSKLENIGEIPVVGIPVTGTVVARAVAVDGGINLGANSNGVKVGSAASASLGRVDAVSLYGDTQFGFTSKSSNGAGNVSGVGFADQSGGSLRARASVYANTTSFGVNVLGRNYGVDISFEPAGRKWGLRVDTGVATAGVGPFGLGVSTGAALDPVGLFKNQTALECKTGTGVTDIATSAGGLLEQLR